MVRPNPEAARSKLAAPNFFAWTAPDGATLIFRTRDRQLVGRIETDLAPIILDALNRAPLWQRGRP